MPKLVDLKKSCDVVGSGKWPADSQEARVKLLKRIQDLALEIRDQVRMQREAFLHHKMDRHFRQSVEQTTLKLQEDLRHLSADVKRRCFTMAEGRRPEEKPESLYDEASQLQIEQVARTHPSLPPLSEEVVRHLASNERGQQFNNLFIQACGFGWRALGDAWVVGGVGGGVVCGLLATIVAYTVSGGCRCGG